MIIRRLLAHLYLRVGSRVGRETRPAKRCGKPGCPEGLHYHWGYGQRHSSLTPVTGPNSFSDGQPFFRDSRLCEYNHGYGVLCRLPAGHDGQHEPTSTSP